MKADASMLFLLYEKMPRLDEDHGLQDDDDV